MEEHFHGIVSPLADPRSRFSAMRATVQRSNVQSPPPLSARMPGLTPMPPYAFARMLGLTPMPLTPMPFLAPPCGTGFILNV